jgi:hypothetical protein
MTESEYYKEVKDMAESCFEEMKETAIEEECFDLWELENNHGFVSLIHETLDSSAIAIYMDLTDAAEILKYCNYEETDSGLWEGQDPEEAIKTKAFFSMRQDIYEEVENMLENLREEIENS